MKNILIVVVAVALLALGWFLLSSSDPDVDGGRGGENESVAEEKVGDDEPKNARPDRESIATPPPAGGSVATPKAAELDPGLGALDLRVVYQKTGKPVPRARVFVAVRDMGWDDQSIHEADEDGRILIENLRPGGIYVKALRGGERGFTIFGGKTKRGKLAIPTGVLLKVEVTDAEGAPIEKASVWLSERYRDNRGAVVGQTDYRGRLELQDVSPHCSLAVRCEGFEPSRIHRIRVAIGGAARIPVTLKRGGGMLEGTVVDPRGKPVAKARVLIGAERTDGWQRTDDGSWVPGAPPILRVTDAKGRFAARMTASGKREIQVLHPDFAPFEGEAEALPGAPVTQRIVLAPGATLFGVAEDAKGAPVPHARVMVGLPDSFAARSVFSDRGGAYEIRGLGAGEQRVVARRDASRAEAKLRFAVGERLEWNPELGVPVALDGKKMLVGRVVDGRDEPLERWRVAVRDAGQSSKIVSTNTDAKGAFRIAVEWDEVRVFTHAPGMHTGFPALIRDGVRVADGAVVLRVEDAALRGGVIRGVTVDSTGRFLRAQVQVWHQAVRLWRTFETDAKNGEFRIENLPPGKLDLKVTSDEHPWLKLPEQTIAVGQTIDLGVLTLQSGGRVEGTVRIVGGRVPEKIEIGVYHEKGGGEAGVGRFVDGRFRTGALGAGTYTLQVQGERVGSQSAVVVVRSGATTTKSFVLQPAALRELKFTIPEGVKPPNYLNVLVRAKTNGKLAGMFGLRTASGDLRGRVSLVPGEYVVRVWAAGSKSWLAADLKVESLADSDVSEFELRPRR